MRERLARFRGQALVEFALVFPFFMLLLMSVIVLGLYVFYNQQLESAAREAARFAAVRTSTAQCPVVPWINPVQANRPDSYSRCDSPELGWPKMTTAAKSRIWGMPANQVSLAACWSGLVDESVIPATADNLPSNPSARYADCTMSRINPRTAEASLPCPAPATVPSAYPMNDARPDGDDKASSIAAGVGTGAKQQYPTTVTVYTCFIWTPPMSGFLFIPSQITLRAVITEGLQRQQ